MVSKISLKNSYWNDWNGDSNGFHSQGVTISIKPWQGNGYKESLI
jgi:hypothetical protein